MSSFVTYNWTAHRLTTVGGVPSTVTTTDGVTRPRWSNDPDPQTAPVNLSTVFNHRCVTFDPPTATKLFGTGSIVLGSRDVVLPASADNDALLARASVGDILHHSLVGWPNAYAQRIERISGRTITTRQSWAATGTDQIVLAPLSGYNTASITAAAAAAVAAGTPRLRLDMEFHAAPASVVGADTTQDAGRMLRDVIAACKAASSSIETGLYLNLGPLYNLLLLAANPSNVSYQQRVASMRRDNESLASAGLLTAAELLVTDLYPIYDDAPLEQYNLGVIDAWLIDARYVIGEINRLAPNVRHAPAIRTQYPLTADPSSLNAPVGEPYMLAMASYLQGTCHGMHVWGQEDYADGIGWPSTLAYDLGKGSPSWAATLLDYRTGRW
jgi:hypothetical protein